MGVRLISFSLVFRLHNRYDKISPIKLVNILSLLIGFSAKEHNKKKTIAQL